MAGNIEFRCDRQNSKTRELCNFKTARKWNLTRHIQKHGYLARKLPPDRQALLHQDVNYLSAVAATTLKSDLRQNPNCHNFQSTSLALISESRQEQDGF